jgi:hypothetical protein
MTVWAVAKVLPPSSVGATANEHEEPLDSAKRPKPSAALKNATLSMLSLGTEGGVVVVLLGTVVVVANECDLAGGLDPQLARSTTAAASKAKDAPARFRTGPLCDPGTPLAVRRRLSF